MPEITGDAEVAYAASVAAVCAGSDPSAALRRAVDADPTWAVALADLHAWTGAEVPSPGPGATPWERRHLEIVAAAVTDPLRAEALLREHTTRSGCDPLALLIVARHMDGIDGERLADLRGRACTSGPTDTAPARRVSTVADPASCAHHPAPRPLGQNTADRVDRSELHRSGLQLIVGPFFVTSVQAGSCALILISVAGAVMHGSLRAPSSPTLPRTQRRSPQATPGAASPHHGSATTAPPQWTPPS
jgi:hypothetical protein